MGGQPNNQQGQYCLVMREYHNPSSQLPETISGTTLTVMLLPIIFVKILARTIKLKIYLVDWIYSLIFLFSYKNVYIREQTLILSCRRTQKIKPNQNQLK